MTGSNFDIADIIKQSALVAANRRADDIRNFLSEVNNAGVSFVISLAKKIGGRHITVAFANNSLYNNKNVISVATAICHPGDEFDAAEGMKVAAGRLFETGGFVVYVPEGSTAKDVLVKMFAQ